MMIKIVFANGGCWCLCICASGRVVIRCPYSSYKSVTWLRVPLSSIMSERNPDSRPLPEGWIAQYDHNYKAWFYVNTFADPPVSRWEHPAGPPQPAQYLPPPVGPGGYAPQQGYRTPSPGGYNQGAQGQASSQRGYYQGAPPDDLRQGNWQQYPQQGSGWQQYPPQWQQGPPVRYDGSYGQDYPQENPPEERRGFFGHHRQQQQQPQGTSSKSSGLGMVGAAAAGLVGGLVIEDLVDDFDGGFDGGF